MEYKILEADNATSLALDINKHLSDGWVLHGELVAAPYAAKTDEYESGVYLFQAVTKKNKRSATSQEYVVVK